MSGDTSASNCDEEPLNMIDHSKKEACQRVNKTGGILMNKMNASSLSMQESTDTLVDEVSSVNKKRLEVRAGSCGNSATPTQSCHDDNESIHLIDDVFEVNMSESGMECTRGNFYSCVFFGF